MSSSFVYYAELTRDQKVQKLSETDLGMKSCRARSSDGLRCTLDAHHAAGLGTAHIHRTPSGEIIAFQLEEKVSLTIATEKEQ